MARHGIAPVAFPARLCSLLLLAASLASADGAIAEPQLALQAVDAITKAVPVNSSAAFYDALRKESGDVVLVLQGTSLS